MEPFLQLRLSRITLITMDLYSAPFSAEKLAIFCQKGRAKNSRFKHFNTLGRLIGHSKRAPKTQREPRNSMLSHQKLPQSAFLRGSIANLSPRRWVKSDLCLVTTSLGPCSTLVVSPNKKGLNYHEGPHVCWILVNRNPQTNVFDGAFLECQFLP